MRILFALHSHRIGARVPLTLKRLLQLATLDGAVDLGIADRTGSITPGKRADLVLLRTTDLNMAPVSDPYEAVVSFAQPANVDTVLIDGRILRRGGKSTAFDDAKIVAEAREAAPSCARKPSGRLDQSTNARGAILSDDPTLPSREPAIRLNSCVRSETPEASIQLAVQMSTPPWIADRGLLYAGYSLSTRALSTSSLKGWIPNFSRVARIELRVC